MRIALTGATGFLGRYILAHLTSLGHTCRCWHRPTSDLGGIDMRGGLVVWVPGGLGVPGADEALLEGCDAVVHAALDRPDPGRGFRGAEGDLIPFVEKNVMGTLRLIESARRSGVGRFVFISTGAVHEKIAEGHPIDETLAAWPLSHYGASKAALEAFVHSYGYGQGYPICALRPTGIYGLARPPKASKWFDLIQAVAQGREVNCRRGGKEVHAADVARAVEIVLAAEPGEIAGESFECYDRYISEYEVAAIAKDLAGTSGAILGAATTPRNEIVTAKLRALGMSFGGRPLLERTIGEILARANS